MAQAQIYTEEDYYNLPENVRAELIEGNLIYNLAVPSRIHQVILMELSGTTLNQKTDLAVSIPPRSLSN